MHGFSKNLDLSFLHGQSLEQLCYGQFDLQLRFDRSGSISIFGRAVHRGSGLDPGQEWRSGEIAAPSNLPRLLGRAVTSVSVINETTLRLTFDNQDSLDVFDEDPQYEACTIASPNGLMVI